MRASIEVRSAHVDDLPEVAGLCVAARSEASTPSQISSPDPDRIRSQLGVLLSIDGGQIYLATHEDRLVGMMLFRVITANIYNDDPALFIEALYVDVSFRRRGVGHALLRAAAQAAADAGAVEVLSVPIPGSRGVQRFLARMGFAPAATHRSVSTAVLLRKLETEANPVHRPARGLEDLIARRRKARIETQSGPVDLRKFQEELAAPAARMDTTPAEQLAQLRDMTGPEDELGDQAALNLDDVIEYPPRVP